MVLRCEAAIALGKIGGDAAVKTLEGAARSGDVETRQYAIQALGATRYPGAIPPVATALGDCDSRIRLAAAKALGPPEDARAIKALEKALDDRCAEVRSACLSGLRSASPAARRASGCADLGILLTWAKHPYAEVRAYGLGRLGELADPRALGTALAALEDQSEDVAVQVALSLAGIGGEKARTALLGRLRQATGPRTWAAAAAALGLLKERRAVPLLTEALRSMKFGGFAIQPALLALGEIGDRQAVGPLLDFGRRHPTAARAMRIGVLARLGDEGSWRMLLQAAEDADNTENRKQAALWLGYTRSGRAAEPLTALLSDPEAPVRGLAATGLAKIRPPRQSAVAALMAATKDPSPEVRRAAAAALRCIRQGARRVPGAQSQPAR